MLELFGEHSGLRPGICAVSRRSSSDISASLMLPATAVRDVFDRDAHFALAIVTELAVRYRNVVLALKDQNLRTGIEHLANWILEEERRQGGSERLVPAHDKRTLSSRLVVTLENLSRHLAGLLDRGVTSRGRQIFMPTAKLWSNRPTPDPLIDGGG